MKSQPLTKPQVLSSSSRAAINLSTAAASSSVSLKYYNILLEPELLPYSTFFLRTYSLTEQPTIAPNK